MSTVIRSRDVLALTLTVNAGLIGDMMQLTSDRTCSIAGAGCAKPLGILSYKPTTLPAKGTVETPFNQELEVVFSGTVAAGEFVKVGTASSTTQRYAKWTQGVDNESLRVGMCLVGGDVGDTGYILV